MHSQHWKPEPCEREQKRCHYTHGFQIICLVSISHHKHQYLKMLGRTLAIQIFSLCKGSPDTVKKLPVECCALPAALPALLRWGNKQQVPLEEQMHPRVSPQGSERQIRESCHFKKWPSARTDWLHGCHIRKKKRKKKPQKSLSVRNKLIAFKSPN